MISEHHAHIVGINTHRRASELSLLFSGYGWPEAGHAIGPTVHDYYLIHTVRTGHGIFACRNKQYECSAGDTFVIFPGELFRYEADAEEPWHYMWAAFVGRAAGELLQAIGATPDRPVLRGATDEAHALYDRMRETLQEAASPMLDDLACAAYLRLLLVALGQSDPSRLEPGGKPRSEAERRVRYAAGFLDTQFAQQVSIERLADDLGYHRTYFSQLFKHYMGKPPKQYLYEVRMEQAAQLLSSTALTVEQVAGAVGYNDPLYFSKHYQKWSGKAPTAYRKQV